VGQRERRKMGKKRGSSSDNVTCSLMFYLRRKEEGHEVDMLLPSNRLTQKRGGGKGKTQKREGGEIVAPLLEKREAGGRAVLNNRLFSLV